MSPRPASAATDRELTIIVQGASKDAPWKLLSEVLKRLCAARFVTISSRDLTDEEPTYKLHYTGGDDPRQLDLPF